MSLYIDPEELKHVVENARSNYETSAGIGAGIGPAQTANSVPTDSKMKAPESGIYSRPSMKMAPVDITCHVLNRLWALKCLPENEFKSRAEELVYLYAVCRVGWNQNE